MSAARLSLAFAAVLLTATPGLSQLVNYEMVTVGEPGNTPDTNGYGAVTYEYQIGKYEVTIGQYVTFLNAVATNDTYGLYSSAMDTRQQPFGEWAVNGISRSGEPGAYLYSAFGPSEPPTPGQSPTPSNPVGADNTANRPIAQVSWFNAARFANWMANGQPTGDQIGTTTENGAYNLSGATTGDAVTRNAINPNSGQSPTFYIPTYSEWYKAAYYSPVLNSGSGGYWYTAAQSNAAMGNQIGSQPNQANSLVDGFSVTQSSNFSRSQNYLTNVGAFSDSRSFYGTFDQAGNLSEWNDLTAEVSGNRGLAGGNWRNAGGTSIYSGVGPSLYAPDFNSDYSGFRLASPVAVPEPSTLALAAAGIACGGYLVRRYRRRA